MTITDRRVHSLDHYSHERTYIEQRRKSAAARTGVASGPVAPKNLVGLAFSGGGIRSASVNLGVLQALERENALHRVDYLSAVSGGAYIASWYVAGVLPHDAAAKPVKRLNGVLVGAQDPRHLLLGPYDESPPAPGDAYPIVRLRNGSKFLLDGSGWGQLALPSAWLWRVPVNLIFDAGLHFKPTAGKFNTHHSIYPYRDRIADTYHAGRTDLPLVDVNPHGSEAPYLIVNAALSNTGFGRAPADFPAMTGSWEDRMLFSDTYGVSPFEFTRDFCGAPGIGYVPTPAFDKRVKRVDFADGFPSSVSVYRTRLGGVKADPFPLTTAVAASGAAFDAAGAKSSPSLYLPLEMLLRVVNLNLRYETTNYAQSLSEWYWWPVDRLVREPVLDRFFPSVRSNSLQISDGAHYENLGVVALVKRRVGTMVIVDASSDGSYGYGSLKKAMRAVAREGCTWTFDDETFLEESHAEVVPVRLGTITCESDGYSARVIYCKSSPTWALTPALARRDPGSARQVSEFLAAFERKHDDFPHRGTKDQTFSWQRFEAYRQLGELLGTIAADELHRAIQSGGSHQTALPPRR